MSRHIHNRRAYPNYVALDPCGPYNIIHGDTIALGNFTMDYSKYEPGTEPDIVNAKLYVKDRHGNLVADFSNKITIVDNQSITIDVIQSTSLPPEKLLYDIQFILSDGTKRTYIQGIINIVNSSADL